MSRCGVKQQALGLMVALAATLAGLPSISNAQSVKQRLERFMDSVAHTAEFHGSVLVTRAGDPMFARSYGFANREFQVRNTTQTRFRIGSITKQFTSMGILMLQERGLLRVDDRLASHLPDLPAAWRDLTIHQLLTHTSGLMHSWALPDFRATMMVPRTVPETVARFRDRPLLFTPGEGFQYSGLGYFMLALIIERVSDQSYESFLRENVFEPLGMHDTGADEPAPILRERASGYVREDGEVRNAPTIYMPILTGGGNLYSTVGDLARWDRALDEGKLISPASYQSLYAPERNNYAYGWRVTGDGPRWRVEHSGGVSGFLANNVRFPRQHLSIVVLSNMSPGPVLEVADGLAEIVLDTPPAPGSPSR